MALSWVASPGMTPGSGPGRGQAMSRHEVPIVRIAAVEPHPQADRLEIVRLWGYTCVVGKGQFRAGDLACYVPPDSVVPSGPPFEFLGDHRLIRVRRYRGVVSQGLLIPAP